MNRPRITRVISPRHTPIPVKTKNRRRGDRTRFKLTAIRSCRFRRMLLSSFRSCSAHFSLRISRSMSSPSNFLRSEFLFHTVFYPADPTRDIGFTDACDFRYFALVVAVEVKQDEGSAQRVQFRDEFIKEPNLFWLALRFNRRLQKTLFVGEYM